MTLHAGARAPPLHLKPARRRKNLTVMTGCRVVHSGRKRTCRGVEYLRDGKLVTVRAEREIVVSAGAINSPQLLMLSGIGPADHLRKVGVPVVHDLPGVGRNLQDHMDVYLVYELAGPYGYDRYKALRWKAWAGVQYALFRSGPVCSNVIEAGAFWRANGGDPNPDIQYAFLRGPGSRKA